LHRKTVVCRNDENHSVKYVTGITEQMIHREMFGSVIAVVTNTTPSKLAQAGTRLVCKYNGTLRCVRVSIVVVEKQYVLNIRNVCLFFPKVSGMQF
jgi:hypothetical protein